MRVTWNASGWNQLAVDIDRGTARAAGKVRDDAKRIIADEGRVDTGEMMNSLVSEQVSSSKTNTHYQITARAKHSLWQHEGVEGPIVPKRAKVLRFKGSSGAFVFAPSVKGFKGIYFLTRALDDLKPEDFRW